MIAAQMPIENKRMLATYLVDNSGSREATRGQVDRIWREALALK
jgi:dephospho-CoA kinase